MVKGSTGRCKRLVAAAAGIARVAADDDVILEGDMLDLGKLVPGEARLRGTARGAGDP